MEVRLSPAMYAACLPIAAKRAMLRRCGREVSTLALGSSHGDFGFNPVECRGAFNLCSTSQDFRHSAAIYRRVGRELQGLNNLVLFYSVFSPGHVLEQSPTDRHHCLAMNELLDLGLSYDHPELARHVGALKAPLSRWEPSTEGEHGFLPNLNKTFFSDSYGAARRAEEHLKRNASNDALIYLASALLYAGRLGHRALIVIPPARFDYKRACAAPSAKLFRGLRLLRDELQLECRFDVLNLFDDSDFLDAHFGDFDHLNPLGEGPRILARKVQDRLS